jgi:hypothetical protein
VGAKTKRAASLVMALALSGTPALPAACALLCVADTTHAATGHVAPADSHRRSCCVPDREAPPTGHAHHGTHDTAARPPAVAVLAPDDASQVAGADATCCPDSRTAGVASAAIARADGGLLVAPPVVVAAPAVRQPSPSLARVGTPHRPLRSPTRTPLVLRI